MFPVKTVDCSVRADVFLVTTGAFPSRHDASALSFGLSSLRTKLARCGLNARGVGASWSCSGVGLVNVI